jgi:hypothetical protein
VGFAGQKPDAEPLRGLEHPVVVVAGTEIERGGGSAGERLGDAELCRRLDSVSVEGRLVRPGEALEPLQQCHPVGLVAQ